MKARYFINKKELATYTFDDDLDEYVRGEKRVIGQKWDDAQGFTMPLNIQMKHWVALYVDLSEFNIKVYDLAVPMYRDSQMRREVEPIAVMMPMFLKHTGLFKHLGDKLECTWPMIRVKGLVHNERSGDCGLFTYKFIEYLLRGLPLEDLKEEKVADYRLEVAVGIWSEFRMKKPLSPTI